MRKEAARVVRALGGVVLLGKSWQQLRTPPQDESEDGAPVTPITARGVCTQLLDCAMGRKPAREKSV